MIRGMVVEIDGHRIELLHIQPDGIGFRATGQTAGAKHDADGYWFQLGTARAGDPRGEGSWCIRAQKPRFANGSSPRFTDPFELGR